MMLGARFCAGVFLVCVNLQLPSLFCSLNDDLKLYFVSRIPAVFFTASSFLSDFSDCIFDSDCAPPSPRLLSHCTLYLDSPALFTSFACPKALSLLSIPLYLRCFNRIKSLSPKRHSPLLLDSESFLYNNFTPLNHSYMHKLIPNSYTLHII